MRSFGDANASTTMLSASATAARLAQLANRVVNARRKPLPIIHVHLSDSIPHLSPQTTKAGSLEVGWAVLTEKVDGTRVDFSHCVPLIVRHCTLTPTVIGADLQCHLIGDGSQALA